MISRTLLLLLIMFALFGHTSVFALPNPPEQPFATDDPAPDELIVFCGIFPFFDPVETMPAMLMDQPRDTQKVEQLGEPVGESQDPAPVPEPASFILVGIGLLLIGIVRKSLRT